jgi:hypothetical protein
MIITRHCVGSNIFCFFTYLSCYVYLRKDIYTDCCVVALYIVSLKIVDAGGGARKQ